MKKIILEDGEEICSKCEGRGYIKFVGIQHPQTICRKCNGAGKLDWVSNAMGEPPPPPPEYDFSPKAFLGYNAGFSITSGSENIAIGYNAGMGFTNRNEGIYKCKE